MLLSALGVVDLTLSGSLVVIVILSGYVNFIAPVDIEMHKDWPRWIAKIDFSELKLKLMASIVAITAIKLLEGYMNVGSISDRDLAWQTGRPHRLRRHRAAARARRAASAATSATTRP